jgi:hypothetical protein
MRPLNSQRRAMAGDNRIILINNQRFDFRGAKIDA